MELPKATDGLEPENPLHDIKADIAFDELEEIDLEAFFGKPDEAIEQHLRSLAERASVGQLRQVLQYGFDREDLVREVLVERFVSRKLDVVLRVRRAIQATSLK